MLLNDRSLNAAVAAASAAREGHSVQGNNAGNFHEGGVGGIDNIRAMNGKYADKRLSMETPLAVGEDGSNKKGLRAAIRRGGRTSFDIGGLHAIALLLTLWALHRKSSAAGESAVWALIVILAAREWIGGPVTLPSSKFEVPLLHDPSAVRCARDGQRGLGVGFGARKQEGGSCITEEVPGDEGKGVTLVGAKVEILDMVGRGRSGFDRFCIRVRASPTVRAIVGVIIGDTVDVDVDVDVGVIVTECSPRY